MFTTLKNQLSITRKVVYFACLSAFRRSDYKTWAQVRNLDPDWDERSELLAALVPPDSSVVEFGAGRLALKKFLPSGCSYTPSDLVDRGQGTIVLDLNAADLPILGRFDVAIFGGVLEYIYDLNRLANYVSNIADTVIFSYVANNYYPERVDRCMRGWVNDNSCDEIVDVFERVGYRCEDHERLYWNGSLICRMSKKGITVLPTDWTL